MGYLPVIAMCQVQSRTLVLGLPGLGTRDSARPRLARKPYFVATMPSFARKARCTLAMDSMRSNLWWARTSRMAETMFTSLVEQHYASLRQLAARAIRNRAYPERISPTSLVSDCMVRLLQQRDAPASEEHLRGLATVFMARVLADAGKSRRRKKRGSSQLAQSIDDRGIEIEVDVRRNGRAGSTLAPSEPLVDRDVLLAAMEGLAAEYPRQMEVLTLHLVADIPLTRVAELVGVSERTAFRDLDEGRRALARKLREVQ